MLIGLPGLGLSKFQFWALLIGSPITVNCYYYYFVNVGQHLLGLDDWSLNASE